MQVHCLTPAYNFIFHYQHNIRAESCMVLEVHDVPWMFKGMLISFLVLVKKKKIVVLISGGILGIIVGNLVANFRMKWWVENSTQTDAI